MKIKQFLLLNENGLFPISRWLFISFSYQLFSITVPLLDGLSTVTQLFYSKSKHVMLKYVVTEKYSREDEVGVFKDETPMSRGEITGKKYDVSIKV